MIGNITQYEEVKLYLTGEKWIGGSELFNSVV